MDNNLETQENRRLGIRTKKKPKKIFSKILLGVMIICISLIAINYFTKDDYITLSKSEINLYINAADAVSKGKLQVDWKNLAAIDGVRYKKVFSKANKENLKELGELFLMKNSTSSKKVNYKLISIDDVLNNLSFNNKNKDKIHKYLAQLEFIGLVNGNLKKDSSCKIFIEELSPKSIELYNKYKILPSITIAQCILESAWGKSTLSVKANNLFGIKSDSSWRGKSVNMTTSEYNDTIIKANFRRYENKVDSLDDYGKFLFDNDRYKKNGVFEASQYIQQAQALENAGYSTKQDNSGNNVYADLLVSIIKENDLQLIDNRAQSQK
ncbi:glucosaminidase domain-containing protein [Clostridium tagluense]|uniref:glycoside hydrolase family 73 protein n=1 Tax=Clostridium tagluense TaxID=360422 RepID=UPI001C0D3E80|nr:glucosaminidase domain-containing protein [Clostridium tagluense]MBU3128364.1 glucosaminidase domain-containing protein [Clostridium tagluense]MCB2313827.1 glucosaminidase domain-containing protein [Clostridium tagluense]MCB2318623.1 glucosaminidase domain-containing protein [Clostridium tagluense]MCB2323498.1 glucosaminidase domain-containing protein [Clostridium tagluense]MCB2328367.1 glucosaminidase domain-containing protein [Clostridium tagluense]